MLIQIKEIQEYINKNINDNYDIIEINYNDDIDKHLNKNKEYYDNNFINLGKYKNTGDPTNDSMYGYSSSTSGNFNNSYKPISFEKSFINITESNPKKKLYTKKDSGSGGKKSRRRTTRRKKTSHKKKTNRRRTH